MRISSKEKATGRDAEDCAFRPVLHAGGGDAREQRKNEDESGETRRGIAQYTEEVEQRNTNMEESNGKVEEHARRAGMS